MFDPTKPVQTRDGRKARILCTDADSARSIVALVLCDDKRERPFSYYPSGSAETFRDLPGDLVNVPEPVPPAFDPTKPVQTRDGRKVRILCTDRRGRRPIVGLIEENDGAECLNTFNEDGRCGECSTPSNDLVNIPERRTLGLYKHYCYGYFAAASSRYDFHNPNAWIYVKDIKIEV